MADIKIQLDFTKDLPSLSSVHHWSSVSLAI